MNDALNLMDSPWTVGADIEFDMTVPLRARAGKPACEVQTPHWPARHDKFPGHEFALHASFMRRDEWTLSEKTTGMSIGYGETCEKALAEAEERLAKTSPERLAESIAAGMAHKKSVVMPGRA